MKIQKIFSDMYDYERLYSVLMNEDEMYLYQSLFSDDEEEPKKGLSRAAKIGIGTGITAGVGAGGVVGAKYLGKHLQNKKNKEWEKLVKETWKDHQDLKYKANLTEAEKLRLDNYNKKFEKLVKKDKFSKNLQNPYDKSKQFLKDAQEWVKKNPKKAAGIVLGAASVGAAGVYGAKKLRKNRDEE